MHCCCSWHFLLGSGRARFGNNYILLLPFLSRNDSNSMCEAGSVINLYKIFVDRTSQRTYRARSLQIAQLYCCFANNQIHTLSSPTVLRPKSHSNMLAFQTLGLPPLFFHSLNLPSAATPSSSPTTLLTSFSLPALINTFHFHSSPMVLGMVCLVGLASISARREEMWVFVGSMEAQKRRLDFVYSWLQEVGDWW